MEQQGFHRFFETDKDSFEDAALELFRFQARENPVYRAYLEALQVRPEQVQSLESIPFLPIRFFKTHPVCTTSFEPVLLFESSGTTGMQASRHLIRDISLYEESFTRGFEQRYGPATGWCMLGLLPSYLERGQSSLVYMVDRLMQRSGHPKNGFYLYEEAQLAARLLELEKAAQPALLLGVTYALLDFAAAHPMQLKHTVVMETGGMKGRREELLREEVHARLKNAFGLASIHSEYGMTELLSQAYSAGDGVFYGPSWMRVLVRDEEDPLTVKRFGTGVINIIDLANIYSCAFIATEDAGRVREDGGFEVLGRIDGSDLRGCSLLIV